ncbi:PREDICTED: snake venom 5'-nucleotidase-like [Poecilia mexicana]|uniref:snake venom 5'-nucleotidase-like n=1 Tax=Poecilia mexicana TaxID=48701 RepID=UPI00072DC4AD|nr:PREDICTED: snake venom 5'-nucleotidase-like [Poecilia mexicana]
MEPFLRDINCSVLSANIRPDTTLASTFGAAFQPYKIFEVGGQRVGVVGYTSRETPALSQPGPHLEFLDEVSALQPVVNKLETLGVNKVIALGHSGIAIDRLIARKVRGVDVVIGGHTNTFLYTGRLRSPVTEVQVANQRAGLQTANQRAGLQTANQRAGLQTANQRVDTSCGFPHERSSCTRFFTRPASLKPEQVKAARAARFPAVDLRKF